MNLNKYTYITNDSRKVIPGSLFIAVNACGNDGRAYISDAIAKGASAVMYEPSQSLRDCEVTSNNGGIATPSMKARNDNSNTPSLRGSDCGNLVEFIEVPNSRLACALTADEYYGHPSRKLKLIGITGTNGKTTTVTLLYDLCRLLGYKCGLLSTIANYVNDKKIETANTTSDPITINELLNEMVNEGCEYCFMEVSSIGVHQQRIAGLHFAAGIFSNLTHDHLDYHGTFAEYLRCKQMFFDNLEKSAIALTNIDDRNGEIIVQNSKAKVISYSCRSLADHYCRVVEKSVEGTLLNIDGTELWTRLIGVHNAYNLLAVYSCAIELKIADKEAILLALSGLKAAKGRLETINGPRKINVVIDYAHTPDALENVLKSLKELKACDQTELICLFGCGGDRDKTKRPEMAAVAEKYADRIILTSDNSRSEKTEDILGDIRKGLSQSGLAKTISIADRKEAIRAAIQFSKPGTTILLAGKGHETYQILGGEKLHFDEREIVNAVFEEIQ